MSDLLDEYEKRTGHSVPIHVDGASGGFIAPFATVCLRLKYEIDNPQVLNDVVLLKA